MVWLTAWISAIVGAMWTWFASVMPILLIALCGPLAMLNFLHYIWAKLNWIWNPTKSRYDVLPWVDVYDLSKRWWEWWSLWFINDYYSDSKHSSHIYDNVKISSKSDPYDVQMWELNDINKERDKIPDYVKNKGRRKTDLYFK